MLDYDTYEVRVRRTLRHTHICSSVHSLREIRGWSLIDVYTEYMRTHRVHHTHGATLLSFSFSGYRTSTEYMLRI